MDKPPEGKHSTKGLGKKMPQESEYVKWRGNVTVPCGKPVPSNVKSSELILRDVPDEAILVRVNNKVPGLGLQLDSSELNLLYKDK